MACKYEAENKFLTVRNSRLLGKAEKIQRIPSLQQNKKGQPAADCPFCYWLDR